MSKIKFGMGNRDDDKQFEDICWAHAPNLLFGLTQ